MLSFPWLSKNGIISAIDIGHYAAKIIQIKKHKDNSIELIHMGKIKLPRDVVVEGKIEDKSLVVKKLEELFNKINFRPEQAITTLGSKNVIIRNMTLPVMEKEELQEALKWEVEDYLPFSVENAIFDYIIVDETEKKYHLIMVAAHKKAVTSFLSTLKELYIEPLGVNVQAFALLSLISFQGNLDKPTAIIDIGEAGTRVVIGENKRIYLSRDVEIGGRTFTEKLEKNESNWEEADKRKREINLESLTEVNKDEIDLDLALKQLNENTEIDFLKTVTDNLVSEISRSMEYFHTQNRGREVNNIYLTGGGTRLKGLKHIISENIGNNVKELNPFKGIKTKINVTENEIKDMAVVMGLALSEVFSDDES